MYYYYIIIFYTMQQNVIISISIKKSKQNINGINVYNNVIDIYLDVVAKFICDIVKTQNIQAYVGYIDFDLQEFNHFKELQINFYRFKKGFYYLKNKLSKQYYIDGYKPRQYPQIYTFNKIIGIGCYDGCCEINKIIIGVHDNQQKIIGKNIVGEIALFYRSKQYSHNDDYSNDELIMMADSSISEYNKGKSLDSSDVESKIKSKF